jgi:hypothetical protein
MSLFIGLKLGLLLQGKNIDEGIWKLDAEENICT